ncbi:MAG: DUF3501 family protein [Gammaproteobacteria bacterium]
MQKLTRTDLMSLEHYAAARTAMRTDVMAHKVARRIALSPNATLYFEDATTIRYQIQEMLRVERIFEADEIQSELDAYNPLIPDGGNWKATFMFEYADVAERRQALAQMAGIEHHIWVQVGDHVRIKAVANEDVERSTDDKTSAVHFLRFELDAASIAAAKSGASVRMGIEHAGMPCAVTLDARSTAALVADLD